MAYAIVNGVIGNSALMTVLRQEIDRFNNLLHVIHTTLSSLILAIKGEVIMSEALEDTYNAMISQKVPNHWRVNNVAIDCFVVVLLQLSFFEWITVKLASHYASLRSTYYHMSWSVYQSSLCFMN